MIARLAALALLLLGACAARPAASAAAADPVAGLLPKEQIQPRFVPARTIQVWLPPGYARGRTRYPVIYLHDGQNIYDEPAPFSGTSWAVHRALAKGIAQERMRPAILVAVWNTDNRLGEYMPEAALAGPPGAASEPGKDLFRGLPLSRDRVAGDAYLRFPGRGSEAADRCALLDARRAQAQLPDGIEHGRADLGLCAGEISRGVRRRRLPVDGLADRRRLRGRLVRLAPARPAAAQALFRLWHRTDDGAIGPYQGRVDAAARAAGARARAYKSLTWPGHKHTESAWAERVHVPLEFLLGSPPAALPAFRNHD